MVRSLHRQLHAAGARSSRRSTLATTDSYGQILQRDEDDNQAAGDPRQLHYYFNGVGVGDISNNGTSDVDYARSISVHTGNAIAAGNYADFDQSYDPINGLNYESTFGRYTVNIGDTLESIAAQLWGDASFWYMIADANGLHSSARVPPWVDPGMCRIHNPLNHPRLFPYPAPMASSTLQQLDVFAQIVASGSIAECARNLGVPAAAIERDVRLLEERIGHRLFDITGARARLTPAGRKTVEAMQMLSGVPVQEAAPVASAAAADPAPAPPEAAEEERQRVVLAAHPAIFTHFRESLGAFEQANSDVAIALDLDSHMPGDLDTLLRTGAVDIAYLYSLGAPDGMETRYVWSERVTLYVGSGHALAGSDSVTGADLAGVAPILPAPGNGLRPLMEAVLAGAGLVPAPVALETDDLFHVLGAVRSNLGFFPAFGPLARDFGRMEGVRRLSFVEPLPAIEVRQAVSPRMRDDPVIWSLAEFLFQ